MFLEAGNAEKLKKRRAEQSIGVAVKEMVKQRFLVKKSWEPVLYVQVGIRMSFSACLHLLR